VGAVHPLHPFAGIDSARLLLLSDDALSYVSPRHAQSALIWILRTNVLALRRACSTHNWVARVSRSIGNFDTTAKPLRWQVGGAGRIGLATFPWECHQRGTAWAIRSANARNATSRAGGVARFTAGPLLGVRAGHWPPSIGRAVVASTAQLQASRLAFTFLRPARSRCSCRAPGVVLACWRSQPPIHHWRY
jgi:hypothetical protein